jgi:uncharacterized protein YjbI with pentapeptide repeats
MRLPHQRIRTIQITLRSLRHRRRELPLFAAVALISAAALIALTLLIPIVRWYLTGQWTWLPAHSNSAPSALDILKVTATLVAGLGGIIALTVAYRRQREQEDRRHHLRFDAAAEQLGNSDGAIRLAGVYAATALADESRALRPATVQLLCAYLRLNRPEDAPVQQTILEGIAAHTRIQGNQEVSWSDMALDLHGVSITSNLDWNNCRFDKTVDLSDTVFGGDAQFVLTQFNGPLYLNRAHFRASMLAFFSKFRGTVLMNDAVFDKGISAIETEFARGLQANGARFDHGASFTRSNFSNGAIFSHAEFSGAYFGGCTFSRGADGQQADAVHNGDAYFSNAMISGADFSDATFAANAFFDRVQFMDEEPDFSGCRFLDGGSIEGAAFASVRPDSLAKLGSGPANRT